MRRRRTKRDEVVWHGSATYGEYREAVPRAVRCTGSGYCGRLNSSSCVVRRGTSGVSRAGQVVKSSLVSATPLAAFIAFPAAPVTAGPMFDLSTGSAQSGRNNTVSPSACTVNFYSLPSQATLSQTVTMTTKIATARRPSRPRRPASPVAQRVRIPIAPQEIGSSRAARMVSQARLLRVHRVKLRPRPELTKQRWQLAAKTPLRRRPRHSTGSPWRLSRASLVGQTATSGWRTGTPRSQENSSAAKVSTRAASSA
jgi:hypothetical protein